MIFNYTWDIVGNQIIYVLSSFPTHNIDKIKKEIDSGQLFGQVLQARYVERKTTYNDLLTLADECWIYVLLGSLCHFKQPIFPFIWAFGCILLSNNSDMYSKK